MRKANDILQQVRERELTDKELKRREEIADDLPDAEFKKRYGAAWKGIKMATATNMAKKEEVDLEEALSGREVAKRMEKLKDRGVYVLKPWAKEVAKMRTVTRDDLEKLLPDHIGGQYLTKVLESNELEETLQDNISLFSKDQIKLLQVIVPVVSVYGTKKSGSLALERTPNMDIARAVKVQMDWLKKDEFTGSTDHTSFTRDKQLTMLNDIIKKLPRLKSSAPKGFKPEPKINYNRIKGFESNELIDTYVQAITDAVKKEDHPNHKKKVKPGYHIMPDGTMMKDSEHKKEETELQELINYDRQLKDPKKETMVMHKKDGRGFVIDKKDLDKFLKRGYLQIEDKEQMKESKMGEYFLDMQMDAQEMSERDFIKKYRGEMGMSPQELKRMHKEFNEEVNLDEKEIKHDGKGPIKMSKKEYASINKFRKGDIRGKPHVMATIKKGAQNYNMLVPVVFEDVELNEKEMTYTVVHIKKGKEVIKAKSSYDAAKKFAKMKGLRSTAGVDAYLMEDNITEEYVFTVRFEKEGMRFASPFYDKKNALAGAKILRKASGVKDINITKDLLKPGIKLSRTAVDTHLSKEEVEESLMSTMYNKLIKSVRRMPKDQFVRKYVGTHLFPGGDKMPKEDLEQIWKIWNGQESNDLEESKMVEASALATSVWAEGQRDLTEAVDKKTAEWIIKNSTHQRFGGYNFEYYLSREMIDKMKQLKMKPPRGVSATKGGSLSELIKAATGKDVYLDGPNVVMGNKTIGKWKPTMQVGEILKMAGLLRQFQDENDLEERISSTTGTDPADIDIKATDADRKAADKNIIIQLRRAQDMGGKADVTFLDNPRKKMKVDIKIINKALDMFDKFRPVDKAKMQSIISKSYRGLLDIVKRGRV